MMATQPTEKASSKVIRKSQKDTTAAMMQTIIRPAFVVNERRLSISIFLRGIGVTSSKAVSILSIIDYSSL